MNVLFSRRAKSDWEKLEDAISKRLSEKIAFFVASGNPLKYADRLSDANLGQYRFRIGDYRIVFDVERDNIFVLRVGHRKDIYK